MITICHIMKKLTSLLILIVMSIAVAVTARAEFRHGVTAGVTISTLKFKQDLFTIDRGVGPQVGWVGEMTVSYTHLTLPTIA